MRRARPDAKPFISLLSKPSDSMQRESFCFCLGGHKTKTVAPLKADEHRPEAAESFWRWIPARNLLASENHVQG
jgi:hypothetical protein